MLGVQRFEVGKYEDGNMTQVLDAVVAEEPLNIMVGSSSADLHSLVMTMRTPGFDDELALGFLIAEGIVREAADVTSIKCERDGLVAAAAVILSDTALLRVPKAGRQFITNSSCGICGTSKFTETLGPPYAPRKANFPARMLLEVSAAVRRKQELFAKTGGLHATAICDNSGRIVVCREDVGRHNAFDKALGFLFANRQTSQADLFAFVSGRCSYELVQKAAMSQISLLCSVGAPSSAAIDLAEKMGVTLVGFLKGDSFNIYCQPQRIAYADA